MMSSVFFPLPDGRDACLAAFLAAWSAFSAVNLACFSSFLNVILDCSQIAFGRDLTIGPAGLSLDLTRFMGAEAGRAAATAASGVGVKTMVAFVVADRADRTNEVASFSFSKEQELSMVE